MTTGFGFLSKLNFLQDLVSAGIASLNPMVFHTIEKYVVLSKLFFFAAVENIQGDYLEFGVYKGSSLCHALRAYKKSLHYMAEKHTTRFWGFDSFQGFGKLGADDHSFFTAENFTTDIKIVQRRIKRFEKSISVHLVKGFFAQTLTTGERYGIDKAKIIFVDCDTYTAAKDVFLFCAPFIQNGTLVVLDDRLAYRGDANKGETRAFREFLHSTNTTARKFCVYGNGGGVYILSPNASHD
jgi:hypothetical protein